MSGLIRRVEDLLLKVRMPHASRLSLLPFRPVKTQQLLWLVIL